MSNVMLIIHTRIKADKNQEFILWQKKLTKVIEKFTGFLSQTVAEPVIPGQPDWIITQNFVSTESAKRWLHSNERQELLKEISPILVNIDKIYLLEEQEYKKNNVTAEISTRINPKDEQKFLDWQTRIASIQSKYPGFLGFRLEKPKSGVYNNWVTFVAFDSDEHLEAWLTSDERKKMLDELGTFSPESHLQKLYSGFNFWFEHTDKQKLWKQDMLVLLTLYPVVFLLSYVQNPLMARGLPLWLALFFSNAASTVILSRITVPLLMQLFSWWLKPKSAGSAPGSEEKYDFLGTILVIFLYIVSLFIFWLLSKN